MYRDIYLEQKMKNMEIPPYKKFLSKKIPKFRTKGDGVS